MKNILPRNYSFRHEIFPVLVAGMLLNLVTHYLIEKPSHRFIWGDMGGTALVGILLGPWWAATVGILNSAITGAIQNNYFPFGLEQIVGGLTWGYLARLRFVRTAIFQKDTPGQTKNLIYSYLILAVSGGIVCGLVASIIKLVLYPKMGLPLHTNQPLYLNLIEFVKNKSLLVRADMTALFLGDQIRELCDKALVVLLALVFAKFMGFIPDTLERKTELSQTPRLARFKTDAISILIFSFTYAIYLLAARISSPEINIRNAPQSIFWLREPWVLALLYAPIILALISFLLLSYEPESPAGRRLDAERRERESLYYLLISPSRLSSDTLARSEIFHLLKADGVYGLLFTVLLWPSKESVLGGTVNSILIYFGVMAVFAVVFFNQRREFSENFVQARALLSTLHGWLTLGDRIIRSERIFRMLAEIFGSDLKVSETGVKRQGPISYLPAAVVSEKGYLYELCREKPGARSLLILVEKPGNFTTEVHQTIHELLNRTAVELAIIVALSPIVVTKSARDWLKTEDEAGRIILLLGPEDLEDAIYERVKTNSSQIAFVRGRIHVLDSLISVTSETGLTTDQAVEKLANRALPYLLHVLAALPPGRLILDLGAGRGRHAVAALKLGHRVFAVERNQSACEDLQSFASQLGDLNGRLNLRCEDYFSTNAETLGTVDLVIATGILQHTTNPGNLRKHLRHLKSFAVAPYSKLYIEMLFDMRFDGETPSDGRFEWTQSPFEEILETEFPSSLWNIEVVRGPLRRDQTFTQGARSFIASAKNVSCTSVEYLISREG
jgi:SAM-dependent methyltransferase